jgi:alanyl-tRNA synthetase
VNLLSITIVNNNALKSIQIFVKNCNKKHYFEIFNVVFIRYINLIKL